MRLERLHHAFILIILRYHECQKGIKKLTESPSDEEAITNRIASLSPALQDEELTRIITSATQFYPDRTPLLNYCKKAAFIVASLLDSEAGLDDTVMFGIVDKLTDIISTLNLVLKKAKGDKTIISLDGESFELDGLTRSVWAYYSYCASGAIISSTLLPALSITLDSTREGIQALLLDVCQEHQTRMNLLKTERLLEVAHAELRKLQDEKGLLVKRLDEVSRERDEALSTVHTLRDELALIKAPKLPTMIAQSKTRAPSGFSASPILSSMFFPQAAAAAAAKKRESTQAHLDAESFALPQPKSPALTRE